MTNRSPASLLRARRRNAALILAFALAFVAPARPLALSAPVAVAQPIPHPPLDPIPAAAQLDAAGHLDPERATRAYLDTVPAEKRAASNQYYEGGYWLILWDAVCTIVIMLILLFTGVSARLRDFAAARSHRLWLQSILYIVPFTLVYFVLDTPLTWYESYYREHLYQQSHESMGVWLHDQLVGLALTVLLGAILVSVLYAIARRLPRSWHLWGATVVVLVIATVELAFPVFIAPLFNTYSRIEDPAIVTPLLRMAHANAIPVENLYQVDASRQTTKGSANVSGLFGTSRITLNDNLLRSSSIEEIEAVTGHEMGHYVLHHIIHGIVEIGLVFFAIFIALRYWLESIQRRRGARWGSSSIYDVALFPAVVLIFTVMSLLLTPVFNTITRTQEGEADIFGINASRQPDGMAQAALMLGQYRKLDPGPVEEIIFFDHPSGRNRILGAMRWKSQNQGTPGYR